MALIYYAVSLFVSAFLLFLVQPMIGKMILPRLGGTPQVWNTCMMFFQTVLLAGYAYTHTVTSKLPVKKQLLTHCILLLLPIPVLLMFGRPFSVLDFGAEGGGNPIFVTLGLLAMIVGIPFLVVSTTAPLLQRWFNSTGHPAASDPYFLYGASNAGSILGLLLYPLLVERYLGLDDQAWFWFWGYLVLAVLVAGCAFMVLSAPPTVQIPGNLGKTAATEEPSLAEMPMPPEVPITSVTAKPPAPAPSVARTTGIRRGGKQRGGGGRMRGPNVPAPAVGGSTINIKKAAEHHHVEEDKPFEMTGMRRLRWIGLAAVPSSLMLGFTTYISTDISPVPLLWIIPLTLYLLSFVCVFLRWPVLWVGSSRNPHEMTAHKAMVVLQLIAIPAVILVIIRHGYSSPLYAMLICWGAFFLTALVCHGELARDRPPAKYLTEFYLWMSVGGMLGGTFNAMVAPQIPWFGLFEFPLALVFAALVRPPTKGWNLTDWLFNNMPKEQANPLRYLLDIFLSVVLLVFTWLLIREASNPMGWNWMRLIDPSRSGTDYATPRNMLNPLFKLIHKTIGMNPVSAYTWANLLALMLTYGVPIGLALLTWKRPLRLALCFGAVILGNAWYEYSVDTSIIYRDRSYFGILRVTQDVEFDRGPKEGDEPRLASWTTTLMHGTTHHGLNYKYPNGQDGSPNMTRLATTYYHAECPVGIVMERLNWFPGYKTDTKDDRLTYWADARLPASVVGSGAPGFGFNLPLAQLVSAWSEPPYATIGLGTGTMASYARPYQHMTFYEIDHHIRDFSLPPEGRDTYFTYVQGALKRGAKLEIIMGDARLTMTKENENMDSTYYVPDFKDGAERKVGARWSTFKATSAREAEVLEHALTNLVNWKTFTSVKQRESYYRAIEVDAFSSDAIPVHLITQEAIELYMDKLMPNGVLCVHTSNRHVNLVQPVMKICDVAKWKDWLDLDASGKPKVKTGLAWVVCKDEGGEDEGRGIDTRAPSLNGHFRSEYVLVARKQEYLPPYTLGWDKESTKERIAAYKTLGAYATTYSYQQEKEYAEAGLKLLPKLKHRERGKALFNSTVDFYGPESRNDKKVNVMTQSGLPVMDYYGYVVPESVRTWTDDYSNVLSVFRW